MKFRALAIMSAILSAMALWAATSTDPGGGSAGASNPRVRNERAPAPTAISGGATLAGQATQALLVGEPTAFLPGVSAFILLAYGAVVHSRRSVFRIGK